MNQRVLDKWCGHKFYTDHCAWCQETFDISLSAAKRFANYCAPVEKKEPCHHASHPLSNVYDINGQMKPRCEKCGNYYEEKKEQRKLWEIIRCAHPVPDQGGHNQIYQHMASVSIDAVIECYEEFDSVIRDVSFPEYLKEKML